MNHSLVVVVPELSAEHSARLREAAARHGFECHICMDFAQSQRFLPDAEVILGSDVSLAGRAPKLKWMCSHFAGVDPFLKEGVFASPQAILSNSSGAYGVTISEHIVMLLLEILRRKPEYQKHIQEREWVRRLPIRSIYGSRILMLGTGDIGQEVCRRLRAFAPSFIKGVNLHGNNPGNLFDQVQTPEKLASLLTDTDILIISLPGTKETFHLISTPQLSRLPDHAVIINVGRGTVVDQEALEEELQNGRLYAGLDVFEKEPLPAESVLWDSPRAVITPHVAGDTSLPHTVDRIVDLFLEDFENYCTGRPLLRQVDRLIGY